MGADTSRVLNIPKIVSDPEKNKEWKEMNLLILTIQSSLRCDPSGIKIFCIRGSDACKCKVQLVLDVKTWH